MSSKEAASDSNRYYVAYLEISGSGVSAASLHFEVPLWQQRSNVSMQLRASAGISSVDLAPGSIPLLVKLLLFGDDDWLELGLGINIVYRYAATEPYYEFSQSKVNPNAIIGYRYQSQRGGFVFRVGYTPIYDVGNRTIVSAVGLSVGIAF